MAKTILDILLEQGKVSIEKVQGLQRQTLDNTQLEKIILQRELAPIEDIMKAWAGSLNLPFIHLQGKAIPVEILAIIPGELATKYRVISYDKTDDHLYLAVSQPSRLKTDLQEVLNQLGQTKKLIISLAITTDKDIDWALQGYRYQIQNPKSKIQNNQLPIINTQPKSLPLISLRNLSIPQDVLEKFPEEVARRYQMIVFAVPAPDKIKVALADPTDLRAKEILNFIRQRNHLEIEMYQAAPDELARVLEKYGQRAVSSKKPEEREEKEEKKEKKEEMKIEKPEEKPEKLAVPAMAEPAEEKEKNLREFLGKDIVSKEDLQREIISDNVPRIVAAILSLAAYWRASDVHLEGGESQLKLRFRIDGLLQNVIDLPLTLQPPLVARIKILSELKLDEQRIPQDGRLEIKVGEHDIDLRVSTLPTINGEKVVLRLLDKSTRLLKLSEMGLEGKNLELVTAALKKPHGVILVTGPTGSGKSTTLYSMISQIVKTEINIITLEDPVEYNIEGINQCQIKPKIGFGFAEGLRSILRQDPNVIMVGEVRDQETAELVTHAALTGHLVLTTLHTNDAAGALPRLIDMGVEPFLIASSLEIIIGQRLVRRLCPACRQLTKLPDVLEKQILQELATSISQTEPPRFYQAKGCEKCSDGFRGRIGIFEVLPVTEKIEEIAVSRARANQIQKIAVENGMMTMRQDGFLKASQGLTTTEEVLRATISE